MTKKAKTTKCSVCTSADVKKIDVALHDEGAPLEQVAARFKVSRAALGRHKLEGHTAGARSVRDLVRRELGAMLPGADRPRSSAALGEELRRQVEQLLEENRTRVDLGLASRTNLVQKAAGILMKARQLSGAAITEDEVMQAPALRKVLDEVKRALAEHPEALASVVEALEATLAAAEGEAATDHAS